MLSQQVLHRDKVRLPGQCIVTHEEDAARLQPTADKVHDRASVPFRYPAPHAVHADVVEVGQIGAIGELREGVGRQLRLDSAHLRQAACEVHVLGIEIGAEPLRRGGHCMDGETYAMPKTQLARRRDLGRAQAGIQ